MCQGQTECLTFADSSKNIWSASLHNGESGQSSAVLSKQVAGFDYKVVRQSQVAGLANSGHLDLRLFMPEYFSFILFIIQLHLQDYVYAIIIVVTNNLLLFLGTLDYQSSCSCLL